MTDAERIKTLADDYAADYGLDIDVESRLTLHAAIDALQARCDAAEKMLNWIGIHGSFGVDSFTGEVGGNGIRRISATRSGINAAMKDKP